MSFDVVRCRLDVVHDKLESVPAARDRLRAVWHGPSGRTFAAAEQKSQGTAPHIGKRRSCAGKKREPQMLGVPRDRCFDVADDVTDNDVPNRLAKYFPRRLFDPMWPKNLCRHSASWFEAAITFANVAYAIL